MITVILPTYNEALNIPVIVPLIGETLKDCEILIVDDNSPDKTAEVGESLSTKYNLRVIKRTKNRGLSKSVICGFQEAKGEIIVVMDADLSHPVNKLPELIQPIIDDTYDIVVGSRYIKNGSIGSWSKYRLFLSLIGKMLVIGVTTLTDPTSGFMAVRKSLLQGIQLDPLGWKIVLETVVKTGGRVKEIPIHFANRHLGKSKLTPLVIIQYIYHVFKLHVYKMFKR